MSASTRAVFISYASEDSEAGARIAEALKAAGIEVWFDKSELRGLSLHTRSDPVFAPLRGDPRWATLVGRISD